MKYDDDYTEADYLDDGGYYADREAERASRDEAIERTKERLDEMSDEKLLKYLCKKGDRLNTLDSFRTYDVAKRLRDNGWKPTPKQRAALINTAAIALNTEY